VKRLFWFSLGVAVGAAGANRLTEKVKRDGVLVTITQAQAWAAPKIATLIKQLTAGDRSNGIG
jgi:uncharacterized membrane protein YgdD (TMEM256/DUF423 family)